MLVKLQCNLNNSNSKNQIQLYEYQFYNYSHVYTFKNYADCCIKVSKSIFLLQKNAVINRYENNSSILNMQIRIVSRALHLRKKNQGVDWKQNPYQNTIINWIILFALKEFNILYSFNIRVFSFIRNYDSYYNITFNCGEGIGDLNALSRCIPSFCFTWIKSG